MRRAAITIPLSNRVELTDSERLSLRHLETYLGSYDKFLVVPEGLPVCRKGFELKPFNKRFFGSGRAHTALMLSRDFYDAFQDYEFILNYHLDSLVFSDSLEAWCAKGYDYIGPPWICSEQTPWVKNERVGNGGFSLRRVRSFLRVLESDAYWVEPSKYWADLTDGRSSIFRAGKLHRKYLSRFKRFNNVRRHIQRCYLDAGENEDRFWAEDAVRYYSGFRTAPVEVALEFAFEADPTRCIEMNGGKLPFGCHAWEYYEPDFWSPYLLTGA